jgi:TfoX/Sxy family transcriptional regulator of competence genes
VAYSEEIAERVRELLAGEDGYDEKKMFGGLCFLQHGNMVAGVVGDELMVRVGKDGHDEAVAQPHAREMDFTGRSMRGIVQVEPAGFAGDDELAAWVARGLDFVRTLPPK